MIHSKLAAFLLTTATLGAGSVILTPATAQAQADAEVSFEFFHESLSPYGEWIEVGDYGLCWRPTVVDADWTPYTDGYWSYTDAGWTWVSYEDFGAITYHYGRWTNVEDEGWCWVPDYEWGPAWVSWRNSDDYVGWAPLPPEARWEPTVGFSVWVDNSYDIGPSYYNFCAVEDFGAPVIREVIVPRPRNVVIIENTVNITNITVNKFIGVPFCGGPRYDVVIGRVRRPIPALKLVRETNINNFYNNTVINKNVVKNVTVNKTVIKNGGGGRGRALHALQQGNQLIVPAPKVRRVANPRVAMPNIKPVKSVPASKVRKGWHLVQDAEQRQRIKQKLARDAQGLRPETAPARAIQTAELQPVPEKADPNAPSPVITRGRGNRDREDRKDRRENAQEGGSGERAPLKAFNGDDAPSAPGRDKDRKKDKGELAGPAETTGADDSVRKERLERLRKDEEQVARATELQEEFRKRRKEQAQAAREEKEQVSDAGNTAQPNQNARRAERQRDAAQGAAEEIRRDQQARRAEREAAREQAEASARAERQREATQGAAEEARRDQQARRAEREAAREQAEASARAERQREAARAERQREAQAAAEGRRQQMQAEAAQRRARQEQAEAAQQRRQQAAAEARREQMQAMQRQQEARQQREALQQQRAQAMRQQQMQMQRQQGGDSGGGGRGEGRGRRGERGEKND